MQTEHPDEYGELEGIRRQTLKSHNKETSQILARNTLNTRLKSSLDLENKFRNCVTAVFSCIFGCRIRLEITYGLCLARGLIRQRLG